MEEEMQLLAISNMQREAFLNFLDDYPLVIRTLQSRFPADEICERAMVLKWAMEDFCVPAALTELDRAILKPSVEDNDWLEPCEGQSAELEARRPQELAVLRQCAERLQSIGIEIDRIPA